MQAPQRQRLVWLTPAAWGELLAQRRLSMAADASPEAEVSDCLEHWARHDLPLVVTRQPVPDRPGLAGIVAGGHRDVPAEGPLRLALGLPAPACWGRRRLALDAPASGVFRVGDFPPAEAMAPLLPAAARAGWRVLCAGLDALGVIARVYGSHGWEQITGFAYLHEGSDIDLLLVLRTPGQADAAAALLAEVAAATETATAATASTTALAPASARLPRLDGELVFADGTAVAWREWLVWRAGRTPKLLVKRRHGAALECGAIWANPT